MKILEQTGNMRIIKKFFFLPWVWEGKVIWLRSIYVRQLEYQGRFGKRWVSLCEEHLYPG